MHVVRHHHPGQQPVSLAIEEPQRTLYHAGYARLPEDAEPWPPSIHASTRFRRSTSCFSREPFSSPHPGVAPTPWAGCPPDETSHAGSPRHRHSAVDIHGYAIPWALWERQAPEWHLPGRQSGDWRSAMFPLSRLGRGGDRHGFSFSPAIYCWHLSDSSNACKRGLCARLWFRRPSLPPCRQTARKFRTAASFFVRRC